MNHAYLILLFSWRELYNINQRNLYLWLIWLITPPFESHCFQEKNGTAELFTCGRVHINIQASWEPGNQRAHYLQSQSCRSATPERLCRALDVSLSLLHSHWPFCAAHTERWLSCIQGSAASQPPLQRSTTIVEGVFALLGGCDCVEDKQMLLPGRETERLSCLSGMFGERRPLRSVVPGFSRLPRTVPSLWWRWPASTSSGACKARQTEKCAHCFRPWADWPLIIPGITRATHQRNWSHSLAQICMYN